MSKQALFIRHQAKPGRRDDVRRVWEMFVKPRAAANPGHEAYYFCYDDADPDTICVFQLYSGKEAMDAFLAGEWYPDYLKAVGEVVVAPPQISPASLVWQKEHQ
jgi:quinol monooxygenase YgiN